MLLYVFVIFYFFIFKMCIFSIYIVLDLLLVFLILQTIAAVVLICKLFWIKASAKCNQLNKH